MTRPRLLDLFTCSGILADGYAAAGFEVVGVDLDRAALAHNPHETIHGDALEVLADLDYLDTFDVVHASPPCQAYSVTRHTHSAQHPDLLGPVRAALEAWHARTGRPWILENVPGAPMPGALTLCGSEFGLTAWDPLSARTVALRRHRLFQSSAHLWGAGGCTCAADRAAKRIAGVYAGGRKDHLEARHVRHGGYAVSDRATAAALLGVTRPDPPPLRYLEQSVPPAYGRFIGEQIAALIPQAAPW
jgi:DNA (cytosine-5)-methyltransferase 1